MGKKIKHSGQNTEEVDRATAQRGQDRKTHFKEGGSTEEWTGTHRVHDSRPRGSRNRRDLREQAIRESAEE